MNDIFSMGELFVRVQMENIFADGKTFVDCTPYSELEDILQHYEEQKNKSGFNLEKFVHQQFSLPKTHTTKYVSVTSRPIVEHIKMLWDELTRQPEEGERSLISLPYPYIVPGGRFREIFYWDSYFTMLGLQVSGRVDMIENMINNFCFLIDKFGYIPNGNRTYFLGRSQPPFFASMIKLLSDVKGENMLVHYLPQLQKEYAFWMKGWEMVNEKNIAVNHVCLMPDGSILNRYWDENDGPRAESYKEDVELAEGNADKKTLYRNLRAACESGWDFSSRWLKDENDFSTIHTTEIIPVDLNCLLYDLENTIAKAYHLSNDISSTEKFSAAANMRRNAIEKYCWNEEKGFFVDFDYVARKQKQSLTLAGMFPLFFKMASAKQAEVLANVLQNKFLFSGGVQTTTVTTVQQWDAPNGWAPLQWIAIKGLTNYDLTTFAKDIAQRWMHINENVYSNTGKMMEKYNVVSTDLKAGGGEYPSQDGFGWTNGVYLALHAMVKKV